MTNEMSRLQSDRYIIEVHLDRGGRDHIDREGNAWPVSSCGTVLQRTHSRSSSLVDVSCRRCIHSDRLYHKLHRLPYKE